METTQINTQYLLLDLALKTIGTPYRWGGDDLEDGFDCSGLILELLWSVGIGPKYDTTAQGIYDYFIGNGKGKEGILEFGSLLFFGKARDKITHIAFAMNHDIMLEAGGGGRNTNTLEDSIKQNAFVRLRPWKNRGDLIAVLLPDYPF